MKHVAVDLGAESGRIIIGDIGSIQVVHRFPSVSYKKNGHLFWDIGTILEEIMYVLRKAFSDAGDAIGSIGVDAWGVDYVLLDANDEPVGDPFHYRDSRTDGVMDEICRALGKEYIYGQTGIQFMPINTLFQLAAEKRLYPDKLEAARRFLTIPDYINWKLSGVAVNEITIASTTQLYNPVTHDWALDLMDRMDFPRRIFGSLRPPGSILGPLKPEVASAAGAPRDVLVVAPACHDTGSAVVSLPISEEKEQSPYAYISSGTWSLFGYELDNPVISADSLASNYTNEGSTGGGVRFLKNITGLWILQQCKAEWEKDQPGLDYGDIQNLTDECGFFTCSVDINNPIFLKPGTEEDPMVRRVQNVCADSGCPIPQTIGEVSGVILSSLADRYAAELVRGDSLLGRTSEQLYIIGGGSRQRLLCSLTAEKAGIPVYAGPVEATAIGNILLQSLALKSLSSIREGRRIVSENFPITEYSP